MAQWGASKKFLAKDGRSEITVLPHVDTGADPFNPIGAGARLDDLMMTNWRGDQDACWRLFNQLKMQFVDRDYSHWQKMFPIG